MISALFSILIFPGFLFLSTVALYAEYFDRILYARFQNRKGPPWFQPLADFIKLLAKEDFVPTEANPGIFRLMPLVALASSVAAFLYIPLWSVNSLYPFSGDLIVVLYLLTIPTIAFFVGGWYSTSLYARIGSVRTITQMFAYEIPLFMGILAASLLSGSWSLSDMAAFYAKNPSYMAFNVIGFVVSFIALIGKLEKAPFDIPEAETEIVAGSFTEYSGKLLAFFRMTFDIEFVVGASLLAAVFLPFGLTLGPILGFLVYLIKTFFIIALISLTRTVVARLRLDQMLAFSWQIIVPLALVQLFINIILKGLLKI